MFVLTWMFVHNIASVRLRSRRPPHAGGSELDMADGSQGHGEECVDWMVKNVRSRVWSLDEFSFVLKVQP